MYLTVNNYNKTYCLFGGFYEKNTKNLYNFIKEKDDAVVVGPKIFTTDGNIQHSSQLSRIRRIDAFEIGRLFKQKRRIN